MVPKIFYILPILRYPVPNDIGETSTAPKQWFLTFWGTLRLSCKPSGAPKTTLQPNIYYITIEHRCTVSCASTQSIPVTNEISRYSHHNPKTSKTNTTCDRTVNDMLTNPSTSTLFGGVVVLAFASASPGSAALEEFVCSELSSDGESDVEALICQFDNLVNTLYKTFSTVQ